MVLCRADAKLIRHTFGICGGNLMIGVRQAIDIAVGPGLKTFASGRMFKEMEILYLAMTS